jgi:hypothetical protein
MNTLFAHKRLFIRLVLLVFLANVYYLSGQTSGKQQNPIPENINRIFQTSCMPCHGDNGGRLPTSRLKFSRWSAYDSKKQSNRAEAICSQIRKGKMPPKSARDSTPELIPTKEQTELICAWAESLKKDKEKK